MNAMKITQQDKIQQDIILINNQLDTSKTYWLANLEFTYEELCDALGEPIYSGKENDKHRFEWKFKHNQSVYSIYDWKFNNTEFDDVNKVRWFLCGNNDDNIELIVHLLNKIVKMNQ